MGILTISSHLHAAPSAPALVASSSLPVHRSC